MFASTGVGSGPSTGFITVTTEGKCSDFDMKLVAYVKLYNPPLAIQV